MFCLAVGPFEMNISDAYVVESKDQHSAMEGGDTIEHQRAPPSLSRDPSLRLSPIDVVGRSSPQISGGMGSKKRSASQLFSFVSDDSGLFFY
jgi:hypothetical protein